MRAIALGLVLAVAEPGTASAPAGTSSAQNPTVIFPSPGQKTVTLTVCNDQGRCSTTTKTIVVLDPTPVLQSVTVAPARVEVGQIVLLEAQATGKPPLAFLWLVSSSFGRVASFSGPKVSWDTTSYAPGQYTVSLAVANDLASSAATRSVTLLPASANSFYTVAPCRVLDTRGVQPLSSAGAPRAFPLAGRCGIPGLARAVAANVTVTQPTVGGHVSVFPADYPHALVSTINFRAGATRANNAVLPLSTDGNAQLAASAVLAAPGTVHLIVDVSGYFAPAPGGAPPQILAFQARLCPFGLCSFAQGTPVFFAQAFSGIPTLYRYDWDGFGVFGEVSSQPITSHVFNAIGTSQPIVEVSNARGKATRVHLQPISIDPAIPTLLPAAPSRITATFAGYRSYSPVDPTLSGQRPSYLLSIPNTPANLLGYNVYVSTNGGPYRFAAALQPTLPLDEPILLEPFTPPQEIVLLAVAGVNYAGQGAWSSPLTLLVPAPAP